MTASGGTLGWLFVPTSCTMSSRTALKSTNPAWGCASRLLKPRLLLIVVSAPNCSYAEPSIFWRWRSMLEMPVPSTLPTKLVMPLGHMVCASRKNLARKQVGAEI